MGLPLGRYQLMADDAGTGVACHYATVDGGRACTVHCHYAPCPYNGRPAQTAPMHIFAEPTFTHTELLDYWRLVCGGRRPLVIHQPPLEGAVHAVALSLTCWCGPETIDAEEVSG